MNKNIQLTGAGSIEKRRELDFYPTPPEVTHALMQFLNFEPLKIWEPACGNGAMSIVLEEYGHQVTSTDLRHTGYGHGGIDFLDSCKLGFDAIITNPPFAISEQFIRHALKQADVVAMVLKSQYWHASKRVDLFTEHPPAFVLAMTWRPDFLFDQRSDGRRAAPTMECHWTIWMKGDTNTKYRLLQKPAINRGQHESR